MSSHFEYTLLQPIKKIWRFTRFSYKFLLHLRCSTSSEIAQIFSSLGKKNYNVTFQYIGRFSFLVINL